MATDKPPTNEELDAGIQKALDLEKQPPEETPEETPPVETPEEKEETPPSEQPPEETPEETPPAKEEKPKPTTEERYKESTREAQRLYRNNSEMNRAIQEANELPEPTEEELKAAYPEWDEMSATERHLSKEALINRNFRQHINQASAQQREIDKWNERVDKFIEDPAVLADHPELEGKQQKFKDFSTHDKKLVGTDFDILIGAFLHSEETNKPAPKKGQLIEPGIGGSNTKPKPKSDKISVEASAKLRETNYTLYRQLLEEGKIEDNIE